MAFNINEFNAKVSQYGVLKPSSIAVQIFKGANFGLNTFGSFFDPVMADVRFLAEATNIPGVSLATTEIRRHGYGVIEKKPYVPIFTDLEIVFRSDKNGQLYNFFQTWMKMIINFDGRASINSITGVLPNQGLYEVAYKESYMATIVIHVLDAQGNEPLEIVLTEAYPFFLNPIPMAWASMNEYVKVPVKFTFKDWYLENRYFVNKQNLLQQFRNDPQFGPPLTN